MFLAKVEGSVVATKKDPSMNGRKLLLLRPQLVDEKDASKFRPGANTIVAVDCLGAGRSSLASWTSWMFSGNKFSVLKRRNPLRMLPELIKRLCNVRGVSANAGASRNSIETFERQCRCHLPDEFQAFYLLCDGIGFDDFASQILPLDKVERLKCELEEFGIRRSWDYVPFTEDNTSNPVCVCCRDPLAGYIVQVFHDDSPKIKWRNLASLIGKMPAQLERDEFEFESVPADFSEPERSEADTAAARKLLADVRREGVSYVERDDGCSFAAWLFGEEQIPEIAGLFVAKSASV